jgi:hypothetical protein
MSSQDTAEELSIFADVRPEVFKSWYKNGFQIF